MTDNDEKVEGAEPGNKPWWQEAMRELTLSGLAAIFMTEESVRNLLREKKLPKELISLLMEGVNRKKEDFYALLAKEFGKVLGKIDLSREMERFLERHDVQVKATLSFERKTPPKETA